MVEQLWKMKSAIMNFSQYQKQTIIGLSGLVLILVGVLVWQISQKPAVSVKSAEETATSVFQPPAVNPQSKTASRYFSGGGNAIDFREDGPAGALAVGLKRKGDKIEISWQKNIKVSQVQVYNLGKMSDLQDHRIVWNLSNFDLKNPLAPGATSTPVSTPVYLTSFYEIGKIPDGFFNNTFYSEEFTEKSPIFIKGVRYSIEVLSQDKDDNFLMGSYTFDY